MYRPTVRYSDIYKDYVDSLFHATDLDRNQILRLALFASAHTKEFQQLLSQFKKVDVPTLPSPTWKLTHHNGLWREQNPKIEGEGGASHDKLRGSDEIKTNHDDIIRRGIDNEQYRRQQSEQGQQGTIYKGENGGITIRIGS